MLPCWQVVVLGLNALLAAPDAMLPPEIQAGLPQVLAGIVSLLLALRQQQEEAAEAARLEEEEGEEDGEGEGEEDDDESDDEEEVRLGSDDRPAWLLAGARFSREAS